MKRMAYFIGLLLLLAHSSIIRGQSAFFDRNHTAITESDSPEFSKHVVRPLAEFLNPDGSLSLPPEGVEGSLDPSGLRMVSPPGREPRFEAVGAAATMLTFGDENWDSQFTLRGINGTVYALAWDGTNLYAGGQFTAAGEIAANNIARWDGNTWSALGSGVNGQINDLAWDGACLYAGGEFWIAGEVLTPYVAKWDGSVWSGLNMGASGVVTALTWDGTFLYAGVTVVTVDDYPMGRIEQWNGTAWTVIGSGMNLWSRITALASDGTTLYAAGRFNVIGGISASNIAKWDGSAWSPLGSGTNDDISTMALSGTDVYAGGYFTTAGGIPALRIAKWNGSSWNALGPGLNNSPYAMAWDGSSLYIGGNFTTAGGVSAAYIAKWNGIGWSALGSGMNRAVHALELGGTCLFAGGSFASAGGIAASRIANWDGTAWNGMVAAGAGVDGGISAIAWDGANLYIGGYLEAAGGAGANRIAKWDGNAWSALGSGMNGPVYALIWGGSNLFAGGAFTTAGGVAANRIARWDGNAWYSLGTGMSSDVNALAWDGANLYAGGAFTAAGGATAKYIARWNGSGWSALGSGMNGSVRALTWNGTNLFAGGWFSTAGGISASRIAEWDGNSWSAFGLGLNSGVYALSWDGADLYAGGAFTTAGGETVNYIAKWSGDAWRALGPGMNSAVTALAWDGGYLYAGGTFDAAGGINANQIARWNGLAWSPLGSGTNNNISALASDGNSLYAGGRFTKAGGKPSYSIGRWTVPPCNAPAIPMPVSPADVDGCAYTGVLLTWPADAADWGDAGAGTRTYDVLRDGAVVGPWMPYGTTEYTDATGVNGTNYAYSVRYINGCGRHAATPGIDAADLSNAPETPVITGISDVSACAQSGIQVDYSPGAGAVRHDLYKDGSLVATGYGSGATYNPGDTDLHEYSVRAVNGECVKGSLEQPFSDHAAPLPTITGPSLACCPATLSTQAQSSYQWYRNGFIIYGATNQTYDAVAPGTYAVRVTDPLGCQATSSGFLINVSPSTPAITGPFMGCSATGVGLSTGSYASYQWIRDGMDIPSAASQTYLADQSGTYRVRVANAAGCSAVSAGHAVTIAGNPVPAIAGDPINACPAVSVTLSTGAYAAYQWYFNGSPIAGATAQTYAAGVTGNCSVHVSDAGGCAGQSAAFLVFVDFCPATEISPASAIFPLRILKSGTSGTGYHLFFQRVDSTDGYNIYEGELMAPWDGQYHHAARPGNVCGVAATDLGTGEMRAELAPGDGNRYYLVTAYGGGAEGPSGFDSWGSEIPASQSTCTP